MNTSVITLRRKLDVQWMIFALAVVGVLIFQGIPGPQPLDDAYITFRYARNISRGEGFVYNPGARVQGTSTPLFALLLAGSARLIGANAIPQISFTISLLADMFNVWLLYRVARLLLKSERAGALVALVFLFQSMRLNVARGGMETSLFITFLLAMYDRYFSDRSLYQAALFGALALLTRIDAVLAIAPLFAYALTRDRAKAFKAAAVAGLVVLPWFAWAAWYFGNPIPQSILAKSITYSTGFRYGQAFYLFFVFLSTGTFSPIQNPFMIAPGLIISIFLLVLGIKWFLREERAALAMVGYPLLYFLIMGLINAAMFFVWYYLPLMPGLLILYFGAFFELTRAGSEKLRKGFIGIGAALLVLISSVIMLRLPNPTDFRTIENALQRTCNRIRPQLNPGELVYAPDIGVLGWCLPDARILDPIGLVSPESMDYLINRKKLGQPVDQNVYRQMILDFRPDYIISRERFDEWLVNDAAIQNNYSLIGHEPIMADEDVLIFQQK